MSATDTITVGRALPKLLSAEPANGPFSVSVTWAAGERMGRTDIVDLAPMIFTFKVFRPLRDDPALFRTVSVGEWGATLVWAGNDDLEIGAESVEEMAEEVMSNADFAAFLTRNSLTRDAAAAQLGIARRLVSYYAKNREIPRHIALACRYLDGERGAPTASKARSHGEDPSRMPGPAFQDWITEMIARESAARAAVGLTSETRTDFGLVSRGLVVEGLPFSGYFVRPPATSQAENAPVRKGIFAGASESSVPKYLPDWWRRSDV